MATWPPALRRTRRSLAALTACLAVATCGAAARAQTASLEYALKATYLYKFAPFITWPAAAFSSADSPINLCVAGNDPFGATLDRAVEGQQISQRPIVVRRFRTVTRQTGCHIMYVTGSDAQSVGQILDTVRGTPVLTVTNSARNAWPRGVIHFVIESNRVRFAVDDDAAARNGIAISSKLLSLAVSVRPRA